MITIEKENFFLWVFGIIIIKYCKKGRQTHCEKQQNIGDIEEQSMKEISVHVGQRIRLYRKMKNLTLETFAGMIHKSKATVSKYENGDISIDIETLFEIAKALQISAHQLIDYESGSAEDQGTDGAYPLRKKRYYMYFYDGRRRRIIRNVIETRENGLENGEVKANFYADLDDLSDFHKCRFLYHGTMRRFDTFINFDFENQNNRVERAFLYAMNSFSHGNLMTGLFCGLSTQPIIPVSFKFVLSPNRLEEDETLKEQLRISKNDIRQMRKMNMFVIDHYQSY